MLFRSVTGFLYRYIDPISYNTQWPDEYEQYPIGVSIREFEKWGIKITVLLVTLVTYYPCVIWIVTKWIEKRKSAYRLTVIALFLNSPFLLYTDFLMFQFNCVHYSFYLLTIYFCFKKEFYKATFFGSLAILTKQIAIYLAIPVGFYIIAENLKMLNKQKKNSTQKIMIISKLILNHLILGISIFIFTLIPIIYDEGWKKMFINLTIAQERRLKSSGANLWRFTDFILDEYDVATTQHIWIPISTCLVPIGHILQVTLCCSLTTAHSTGHFLKVTHHSSLYRFSTNLKQ